MGCVDSQIDFHEHLDEKSLDKYKPFLANQDLYILYPPKDNHNSEISMIELEQDELSEKDLFQVIASDCVCKEQQLFDKEWQPLNTIFNNNSINTSQWDMDHKFEFLTEKKVVHQDLNLKIKEDGVDYDIKLEFLKIEKDMTMKFVDNHEQPVFDVYRNMDLSVYPEGDQIKLAVNKNRDIGLLKFEDPHFSKIVPQSKPYTLIFLDKRFSNHVQLSIMLMIDSCLRNGRIGGEIKRIY